MPDSSHTQDEDNVGDRGERARATRAVTRYLNSLSGQPSVAKPSRRTVEAALAKLDERLGDPGLSSAKRLKLFQDRRNLQTHGLPARGRSSTDDLLGGFIAHAASYARAHELSCEAFLDFGVPPDVLDKAHIQPTADDDVEQTGTPPPHAVSAGPAPHPPPRSHPDAGAKQEPSRAMRAWLQENGYQIGDRGRIPQAMQDAYRHAHD